MTVRKTQTAIALYEGGLNFLAEAAVAPTGQVFKRYQERGRYGYRWTAWKATGQTWTPEQIATPPTTVEGMFGFGNGHLVTTGRTARLAA